MYVCMYAVVAAAVIIVIVLCYWEVRRRVVACGGYGVRSVVLFKRCGCGCGERMFKNKAVVIVYS